MIFSRSRWNLVDFFQCFVRKNIYEQLQAGQSIMNNDPPPTSQLRKWLMGNKESTLPGLMPDNAMGHQSYVLH